ncbi:hypothetical protein MRF4_21640 [Methylobacterium radiotolerans]|uniref:helix-turn-helix transcriptional regulator n=1 Tax=Methylobacterium TaxID=407 RepID=UPI002F2C59B1
MSESVNAGEICPSNNCVIRFRDACAHVGVSISTMRRYISAGRGPRLVRLSERIHGFRRDDLNAWIESRTAE